MKKLLYVMCLTFAASNIALAFTPKPKKEMMPETTTTQKAAEAKDSLNNRPILRRLS